MDFFVCSKMVAMSTQNHRLYIRKTEKKNDSVPSLRPRVLVTDQKLSDAYDILTLLEAGGFGGFGGGNLWLGDNFPWKEANLTVYIYIYIYRTKETW